jgi:hypothetical protein
VIFVAWTSTFEKSWAKRRSPRGERRTEHPAEIATSFLFPLLSIHSSMRASSTVSGSAPSSITALWNRRTSNLSPARRGLRAQRLDLELADLVAERLPGITM